MEHIIITPLPDNYFRLTPESGYRLYNTSIRKYYSEAVVKETTNFIAVCVE